MTSSVEVFDTRTMEHVDSFSFGILRGSLTWLDRHDGAWWAGFANYDNDGDDGLPYGGGSHNRSEEHTSELQSLMRISYAVFCLKKKNHIYNPNYTHPNNTTYSR